jgi:hypothetical protein
MYAQLLGDEQRDVSERLDLDRTEEDEPRLEPEQLLFRQSRAIRSLTAKPPRHRATEDGEGIALRGKGWRAEQITVWHAAFPYNAIVDSVPTPPSNRKSSPSLIADRRQG